MRIIDATWERRNLGVETVNFIIEATDELESLREAVAICKAPYQTLSIPSGKVDVLLHAAELGFQMIELNISLENKMQNIQLPGIFNRYAPYLDYHEATTAEQNFILDKVNEGNIFVTDKIALDPIWGKEKAGYRYRCWSEQVISEGASVVVTTYKGKNAGFEIYIADKEKQIATNIIGGAFPEFPGLGFAPLYTELLHQKQNKIKKVHTAVSSNNLPVLKLHELLGFSVSNTTYILIKHLRS